MPAFTHCCLGVSLACATTGFQTQVPHSLPAGGSWKLQVDGACPARLTQDPAACLSETAWQPTRSHRFLAVKCWQEPTVIIRAFCLSCFTLLLSEKEKTITHSPWGLHEARSPKPARCRINTTEVLLALRRVAAGVFYKWLLALIQKWFPAPPAGCRNTRRHFHELVTTEIKTKRDQRLSMPSTTRRSHLHCTQLARHCRAVMPPAKRAGAWGRATASWCSEEGFP